TLISSGPERGEVKELTDRQLRSLLRPGLHLLPGPGGLEHQQIGVTIADDLQADGQAGLRPAGGHAGRGLPGEVERIRESSPVQRAKLLAIQWVGIVLAHGKWGNR